MFYKRSICNQAKVDDYLSVKLTFQKLSRRTKKLKLKLKFVHGRANKSIHLDFVRVKQCKSYFLFTPNVLRTGSS